MKKLLLIIVMLFSLFIHIEASEQAVFDDAGLLTSEEISDLEKAINKLEDAHSIDIVIMTSDQFYYVDDIRVWAADFYDYGGFRTDGLIFAINMASREYAIVSSGNIQGVFNSGRIDEMLDKLITPMRNGQYYSAGLSFLNDSRHFLENPNAINTDIAIEAMTFGLVVSSVVTMAFVLTNISSMRLKDGKKQANDYIKPQSLKLTYQNDLYLYSNISRTYINRSSGNNSRSGGHNSSSFQSSSGRSHTGGSRRF